VLNRIDATRSRIVGSRHEQGPATTADHVLVAVTHWRSEADATGRDSGRRGELLVECARECLRLDATSVTVAVLSNDPIGAARDLNAADSLEVSAPVAVLPITIAAQAPSSDRRVVCIGWKPGWILRDGHYLAWAHKRLFRLALRQIAFSHLVYLEDDMRMTSRAFDYWMAARVLLHPAGLIPGFARVEHGPRGDVLVDQKASQPVQGAAAFGAPLWYGDGVTFSWLDYPHQAAYILDRPLAVEHFRSSPDRSPVRSMAARSMAARRTAARRTAGHPNPAMAAAFPMAHPRPAAPIPIPIPIPTETRAEP